MTDKQKFIEEVENLLITPGVKLSAEAERFFEAFKSGGEKTPVIITENGKKILTYLANNSESCDNIFPTKSIAEGLSVSGKSVSGSMKKLITEGFVEKVRETPVAYSITEKGINFINN